MPMVASVGALANRGGGPKHPFFLRPIEGRVVSMKRIIMLVTLALMVASAVAISGVAQAKPTTGTKADAKCLVEAAKTVDQPGFNPSNYTFHGGTEGSDNFTGQAELTAGPDVFCGFGGDFDTILTLEAGDIFLGGAGSDQVVVNEGTFYGGEGNDFVATNNGTFFGEAGDDRVGPNSGTFDGGDGTDTVTTNSPGGILISVEVTLTSSL